MTDRLHMESVIGFAGMRKERSQYVLPGVMTIFAALAAVATHTGRSRSRQRIAAAGEWPGYRLARACVIVDVIVAA